VRLPASQSIFCAYCAFRSFVSGGRVELGRCENSGCGLARVSDFGWVIQDEQGNVQVLYLNYEPAPSAPVFFCVIFNLGDRQTDDFLIG